MKKEILFWCPFTSKVGTISAVIQSSIALSKSKKINCKIMNVYGEFDDYDKILKQYNIKKIRLIKNNLIKFLLKRFLLEQIKLYFNILVWIFSFIKLFTKK